MPFVLNPNALGEKKQYGIKYFILQVGRKARLALAFDRFPQPTTNIYWNPNCLLVKGKKIMSKRKFNILQTNSRLFYAHIYSYHFIFCASEGAAKNNSRVLLSLLFRRSGPFFLWHVSLFHKQQMDCCQFHLS